MKKYNTAHTKEDYDLVMELREQGLGRRKIAAELNRLGKAHVISAFENWIYRGSKPFSFSILTQLKKGYEKLSSEKAYIMGVLCGDGYVTTGYRVGLGVTDKDFAEEFKRCINEVYGIQINLYEKEVTKTNLKLKNKPKNKFEGVMISKLAWEDLMSYTKSYGTYDWEIPKEILSSKKEIKAAFLKGFFDSEGSIRLRKKGHSELKTCSGNYNSLMIVKEILETDFDIELKYKRNPAGAYIIYTDRYKNIKNYFENIGFTIKRKQNILESCILQYKRKGLNSYSKEFKLTVLELYDQGSSTYEIGKLMDFAYTNVYDFIKQRENGYL